jgi:hypothetical protein
LSFGFVDKIFAAITRHELILVRLDFSRDILCLLAYAVLFASVARIAVSSAELRTGATGFVAHGVEGDVANLDRPQVRATVVKLLHPACHGVLLLSFIGRVDEPADFGL